MSLNKISLQASMNWVQAKTNSGGYAQSVQGPDSVSFNLGAIDMTVWDTLYVGTFSIAPAASQNVDLTTVTSLLTETQLFTNTLSLVILPTGNEVTLKPGATTGLTFGLSGTLPALKIPKNGCYVYCDDPAGTGQVVDSTHKVFTLTNTGLTANADVKVVVLGAV